jgi:hypothetical protein
MNQLKTPQAFVRRFDAVRARLLQVQIARALLRALLVVMAGLALLATADYLWEAPRLLRQIGLYGLFSGALAVTAYWVFLAIRHSNRPRTALEIEEHFPELGQSVRTAVQFGGRSDEAVMADGVRTSLVDALEERIDTETRPLPIESVIPTRRLKVACGIVGGLCLVLGILYVGDSEWNTAGRRTLLEERAYTQMSVTPGDTAVELGKDLGVAIEIAGRKPRQITLFTRTHENDGGDWQEQQVSSDDLASSEGGSQRYEVTLPKIKEPFSYRVTAGKIASPEYTVTLRYPLRLEKVEVELTPPAYTRGTPTSTIDGNIAALEGTMAAFRFELDRAPVSAAVVLADPREQLTRDKSKDDETPPEVVPVTIEGTTLTMQMEITQDKVYSVIAEAADGMKLPENSFRIRVRKDQPPQISFDEPREALEVHTLAEVLMRIRVRDDFGLTNAGIVFQVNNEEEHTLLKKDFEEALAEAAKEAADGELPPPTTQAVLDKLLPLEHFELSEQDSVSYYAFAEDNFPAGARRSETDLRFVDIRPFKRIYKLIDLPDGQGMPGRPLAALGELIARQRFAINQAMRLARRPEISQSDLGSVDRAIEFEQKLAAATREVAEFLEGRGVAGNDLLFQAEEAMLAAIDSLSAGKYDNAVLQEKDALRYLIEGRQTINQALLKKPPKTQAEVRAFDRMQTQKLRKPKNEEDAEEVASRLRELANQEEFVYETLSGVKMDDDETPGSASGGSGKPTKKPDDPADPKKPQEGSDKPNDAAADGKKPDESAGSKDKSPDGKTGKDEQSKGEGSGKEGDQNKDGSGDEKKPAGPSREELVQKQADIVAEAADIQKVMEKINGLSDLAKSRIAEALKTAETASGSLDRGESKEASKAAEKASGMFRELARNVEALAAGETAQKIAMARNLSEELSQTEREFANALDREQRSGMSPGQPQDKPQKSKSGQGDKPSDDPEKSKGSGSGGKEPADEPKGGGSGSDGREDSKENAAASRADKLAARADRNAEAGKTLEDILKAIARSNEPADKEAVRQITELMQQGKLGEAVKRLELQGAALRAGNVRETTAEAREMADRFEVTAQKLEGLHRSIVAPRIAELMQTEREAAELKEKLDRLEAPGQITDWHREAEALLDELEKLGIAEESREELVDAMKEAGWSADRLRGNWDWVLNRGYYGAPLVYHRSLRSIVADLHDVIQELILGDMRDEGDENTPPQYERLVERYYQVLSTDK